MLRAMPDATITATTSIDTSGFGAGLEILKEQYRQATTEVRQSVQRVVDAEKQATDAIAAGHVALGAKLSAITEQEKQALSGLIREQDRLKASIAEVNSAMKPQPTFDAAAAMRQLAIVEALAAQGALEEAAAAMRIPMPFLRFRQHPARLGYSKEPAEYGQRNDSSLLLSALDPRSRLPSPLSARSHSASNW